MEKKWYQQLFSTRLSPDKQSVQEFATTQYGYRLATSVGGVLTGRGADVIIIDDPLKPDQALSESQRKHVNEWYDHSLYNRLNSKETGCIILIMQRLHQDDLVGHVLEKEDWDIVSFPAIAEQAEEHRSRDFLRQLSQGSRARRNSPFGARVLRRHPAHSRDDGRVQFRGSVSAIAGAARWRSYQDRLVQEIRPKQIARKFRSDRTELGYCQ